MSVSDNDVNNQYKGEAVDIINQSIIMNSVETPWLHPYFPLFHKTTTATKPKLVCITYPYQSYNGATGPYNALVMVFLTRTNLLHSVLTASGGFYIRPKR